MQRAESPASTRSSQSVRRADKSSYKLFPFVEPTPPASPVSISKAIGASDVRAARRRSSRSSSLDDIRRGGRPSRNGPGSLSRQSPLSLWSHREPTESSMMPMSTVQEQQGDSPTMPKRFTFKSTATGSSDLESVHWRSNSAPDELARDGELYPSVGLLDVLDGMPPPPVWVGRQVTTSTHTLHGLGLTLSPPTGDKVPFSAIRTSRPKQRPSLRIEMQMDEDRPPPPPPKSPRHLQHNIPQHSRSSSEHSRASDPIESPEVAQPVMVILNQIKPTFVTQPASGPQSLRGSGPPPSLTNTSDKVSVTDDDKCNAATRDMPKQRITRKPLPIVTSPPPPDRPAPDVPALHRNSTAPLIGSSWLELEGEKTPRATPPMPSQYTVMEGGGSPITQARILNVVEMAMPGTKQCAAMQAGGTPHIDPDAQEAETTVKPVAHESATMQVNPSSSTEASFLDVLMEVMPMPDKSALKQAVSPSTTPQIQTDTIQAMVKPNQLLSERASPPLSNEVHSMESSPSNTSLLPHAIPLEQNNGAAGEIIDDSSDRPPPTPMKDNVISEAQPGRTPKLNRYYRNDNGFSTPSPNDSPDRGLAPPFTVDKAPGKPRRLGSTRAGLPTWSSLPWRPVSPKPHPQVGEGSHPSPVAPPQAGANSQASASGMPHISPKPDTRQAQQEDFRGEVPLASPAAFFAQSYDHCRPDDPVRERAQTPDLPSGPLKKITPNPLDRLQDLSLQTENLHARYSSLRAERQRISMSMVSSLKAQQAGPEYSNTLLDQLLVLAAINSSIDICFAKLKSLECRKEEVIATILERHAIAQKRIEKLKRTASTRSKVSTKSKERGRTARESRIENGVRRKLSSKTRSRSGSAARSRAGKAQPDQEVPDLPEQGQVISENGKPRSRSRSRARSKFRTPIVTQMPALPTGSAALEGDVSPLESCPETRSDASRKSGGVSPLDRNCSVDEVCREKCGISPTESTEKDEKRNTAIKSPPTTEKPASDVEVTTISPIADDPYDTSQERAMLQHIPVMVSEREDTPNSKAQAVEEGLETPSTTLPIEPKGPAGAAAVVAAALSSKEKTSLASGLMQSSASSPAAQYHPPLSPWPTRALPRSMTAARTGTKSSINSWAGTSSECPSRSPFSVESTPNDPEVLTPKEHRVMQLEDNVAAAADALKQAQQPAQKIDVLIDEDDEILDYYSIRRPEEFRGARPMGGMRRPAPPRGMAVRRLVGGAEAAMLRSTPARYAARPPLTARRQ